MLPNIRVEQYEIKNQGTFDGAKWLTKYDVKIQFADRDIAYAMKDRIDKFLQGEDYRAMYLKVRDELAELQQRTWVGLTEEEIQAAQQEPVAHCEGGPDVCPVCRAESSRG